MHRTDKYCGMSSTPSLYSFQSTQPVDTLSSVQVNADETLLGIGLYNLIEHEQRRTGGIQLGLIRHHHNLIIDSLVREVSHLEDQSIQEVNDDAIPIDESEFFSSLHLFDPLPLDWGVLDLILVKDDMRLGGTVWLNAIGADAAFHLFPLKIPDQDINEFQGEVAKQNNDGLSNDRISIVEDKGLRLSHLQDQKSSQKVIGVALDVCASGADNIFAAWSCSDGTISFATLHEKNCLNNCWRGHDAEVWSVSIDPHSCGRLLGSGGDDCILKLWDIRALCHHEVAHNVKTHSAGVTVVKFDPQFEQLLWTGSYDETLRIWDKRSLSRPLFEQKIADGIWRIKMDQESKGVSRVMVAATHGGCIVYDRSETDGTEIKQIGIHTSHKSMAYGIADLGNVTTEMSPYPIKIAKKDSASHLYVSGSFYDHRVAFWEC